MTAGETRQAIEQTFGTERNGLIADSARLVQVKRENWSFVNGIAQFAS